jgi:hypothetical protein
MREGLERHGIKCRKVDAPRWAGDGSDFVVCWGWAAGREVKRKFDGKKPILVMECGFVGNRTEWLSIGWNGLNGRARFPNFEDSDRWNRNFGDHMKPWRFDPEKPVLLIGQHPNDVSVGPYHIDWIRGAYDFLRGEGFKVRFRPHPRVSKAGDWRGTYGKFRSWSVDEPLQKALKNCSFVVTYNSNSGVESVLEGVPTMAMDAGSMAYPVRLADWDEIKFPDRTRWAHRLAFAQWNEREIRKGDAWDHVKYGLN